MSDDITEIVEIYQTLAGMVAGHVWQGVIIAINYVFLTTRGRVGAAGIVSWITGALSSVATTATGAFSGLSGLFTAAWGAAKNVGTPNMTTIMQIFGPMARDEANKAYHQTNNTTTVNTIDVEYAKAEKEVIKEIANNAEENVKGSGKWMKVFLNTFGIDKIMNKIVNIWELLSDFVKYIWEILSGFVMWVWYYCKMRKTDKQKVLPPKEDTKRVVTPTKRTRARSKSPARKSKSK